MPFTRHLKSVFQAPGLAVVAAFLLRISLLCWIHRDHDAHQSLFFPVSYEMWRVAASVAQGHGFASPWVGIPGPTAWAAPVYAYLLALDMKLFHMSDYAVPIVAQAFNCLFSALTCWPIYALGKRVFNARVGLLSSWLWVFLPMAVLFPLEWLWDPSLSAFLLTVLLYMTFALQERSSSLHWMGYGLLWAVAGLTNPALGILFPFLLGWLAVQRSKNSLPWRGQLAKAVLILILGLLPWTVRNYRVFHQIIPIKSTFGLTLYFGNNPGIRNGVFPRHRAYDLTKEDYQQFAQQGEPAFMKVKQRQAIEFIKAHPLAFLEACFDRFVDAWTGTSEVPWDRWIFLLGVGKAYIAFTTAFSLLAFAGLFFACRTSWPQAAPFLFAIVLFPAPYYVTHSYLRYRHPIDPVLTILAVFAVVQAGSAAAARWAGRRSPGLSPRQEAP